MSHRLRSDLADLIGVDEIPQQWDVAWRSYVHNKFRDRTGPAATRQRDLVLDLSQSSKPVPPSKIPELSPRLAKAYATKSSKTLQRDLVELERMHPAIVRRLDDMCRVIEA